VNFGEYFLGLTGFRAAQDRKDAQKQQILQAEEFKVKPQYTH
jgi:hypothetical protein